MRETTVAQPLSSLQLALSDPVGQRGPRRVAQRDAMRNAQLVSDAYDERKQRTLDHAKWLRSSAIDHVDVDREAEAAWGEQGSEGGGGASTVRSSKSSQELRRSKARAREKANAAKRQPQEVRRYATESAVAMGVAPNADNVYRRAMRRTGAGLAAGDVKRQPALRSFGSLTAVIKPAHGGRLAKGHALASADDLLEAAISKAHKSRRLRFEERFAVIHGLLTILHGSKKAAAGNQRLEQLHEALLSCGVENRDPLTVSRRQFVPIALGVLGDDGVKPAMLERLYSAFDPEQRDRARYSSIVAGVMMGNRPDVYKLNGFIGEDHGRFSDVLPVVRVVFDVYNHTGSGVTADECRELLLLPACTEDDIITMDALWQEVAPGLGMLPRDRERKVSWGHFISGLQDQRGCPVLREFQRQLASYQAVLYGGEKKDTLFAGEMREVVHVHHSATR
mmetsp:Transcript_108323/g.314869  ORF Transcript_108323/g.314869 Transcript_108323/m.314869 type:complete len:450 (+) Transcript_108323:972-2321(+)